MDSFYPNFRADLEDWIAFHRGLWDKLVFTRGDLGSTDIMAQCDTRTVVIDWKWQVSFQTIGNIPTHTT
jgi:hypothetical protein